MGARSGRRASVLLRGYSCRGTGASGSTSNTPGAIWTVWIWVGFSLSRSLAISRRRQSVRRKKLTVDFAGGNQSSAGGLLLLREAERKHGVCRRLAEAMPDRRDPDRVRHAMFEMVMARASAIACGYEDAIDLDRLRHDPLMKVAVGRCPQTGAPLASQSTISRLENAPSKTEAGRLSAAARVSSPDLQKSLVSCMIRARHRPAGGS